jgi:hypothetical protein
MHNKLGKPSTYGINTYIKNNTESLIKEYEYLINDTLYDIYIFTENLGEYKENELGCFYIPDYIIITNEEKYIEYEFKRLSKFKQRNISYYERTLKAILFHELTHAYFYQTLILEKQKGNHVSPEYGTIRLYPSAEAKFGAEFIEEGICEYMIYYLKESTFTTDYENIIPQNKDELINKDNEVNILYLYSVYFIKDFLDKNGVKRGIEILLNNRPPTYNEMINSELFFNRLEKIN